MTWIYLSPHLDDAALSVGGLLWEQSQAGEKVSIWTICGGDPPSGDYSPFAESLHTRWQTGAEAMQIRRTEDLASCRILGANPVHFDIPDCIYRRSPKTGEHLYPSEESLWFPVHPDEEVLIAQIVTQMEALLPLKAKVVCPITLGDHIDHRLTRAAAKMLGVPLLFYADYPYVLRANKQKASEKLKIMEFPISSTGLLAWQNAVAAHASQISTFWENLGEMRAAIEFHSEQMAGVKLYYLEHLHQLS